MVESKILAGHTSLVVLEEKGPILRGNIRADRLGLDGVVHLLVIDDGHRGCWWLAVGDQKIVRRGKFAVRQLQHPIRVSAWHSHMTNEPPHLRFYKPQIIPVEDLRISLEFQIHLGSQCGISTAISSDLSLTSVHNIVGGSDLHDPTTSDDAKFGMNANPLNA